MTNDETYRWPMNKREKIEVRLTLEEKKAIIALAKSKGLNMSQYMISAALNSQVAELTTVSGLSAQLMELEAPYKCDKFVLCREGISEGSLWLRSHKHNNATLKLTKVQHWDMYLISCFSSFITQPDGVTELDKGLTYFYQAHKLYQHIRGMEGFDILYDKGLWDTINKCLYLAGCKRAEDELERYTQGYIDRAKAGKRDEQDPDYWLDRDGKLPKL